MIVHTPTHQAVGSSNRPMSACVAGLMLAALLSGSPALAAKPLINLGPKTAPVSDPISFAAGDDLSKAGSAMIWQNEKGGVKGLKQVVVASFQVEFVTNSSASSTSSGLSQAKVSYVLSGPTAEEMQAITNAAYDKFVADLSAGGLVVIPLEEALARSAGMRRLQSMSKPAPYLRGGGNRSGFYSPPGYKFYFTPNDGRAKGFGDTMTTTGSQVPEEMAMNELDAGVLGVRMVVDFAELEARGRGFMGMAPSAAKVKSKVNVALLPVETQLWVLTPGAKSTMMDLGHRQRYALSSPIVMPASIVSVDDTTTTASKMGDAASNVLGVLSGSGFGQKSRSYEVTVDPAIWNRDVSAAIESVSHALVERLNQDR